MGWTSTLRATGLAVAAAGLLGGPALAADKEVKIGVLYDFTGPFAAGGSEAAAMGTEEAIDVINEKGGVDGYKITPVIADAQSKVEVAISEGERLLNQEHVDLIMGVYASADCVPLAQKVDAEKKFMWITTCVASSVFKDKNLTHVFRAQVHSDQYGWASCSFLNEYSQKKLGIAPKDLKVAIIHEDGPYGSGVAASNKEYCGKDGMQIVLEEGYSATTPDLSSLVTKLRRARPDVILHTGYNPDITLFLRQAKEQGLKFKALIGHGAGYSQIDKLRATFGDDVNDFYSVDPVAAQLLDPKTLKPGLGDLITGDGRALQGQDRGRRGAAARLDGLQPGLDLPDRRPAARDQDLRRHRSRGFAQGSTRHRHPRGRHDPGLRRQVLPARARRCPARTSAPRRWSCSTSTARPRSPGRPRSRRSTRSCPCRPATPLRPEATHACSRSRG